MYFQVPQSPDKMREQLQRFLQENLGNVGNITANRRRPQPPRGLLTSVSSGRVTLTWNGPQNMAGVIGYHLYQNNETNRIQSINNPETLQAIVSSLAAATTYAFYISCFAELFESIKIKAVATTP